MDDPVCEWRIGRPAPPLAGVVDRYVGYRLRGLPAGVHRGMPSQRLTLIATIGEDVEVLRQCDPAQAPARYRCVVGGLQATAALVAATGREEGVQVDLSPLASRALLGLPAGALWNLSLELEDVVGAPGRELWERLQDAAGWEARFAVLDDVLGRLLRAGRTEPALARAWRLVVAPDGGPVGEVASSVGWTRQHLARRFQAEFGLAPKLAARIARFDRARHLLRQGPGPASIGRVAAATGYYDQAHLTRDFVELAGLPPARWLAEEGLPSVQDEAADERAAWAS